MSEEKTAAPPKRGDAPRDWPNTIAAAAKTGLSKKQLNKLAEQGALKVEKDSMGVWRWDPDLLELVAAARESDDGDDGDDAGDARPVRSTGLAEAVALLRQSHHHNEQTLQMLRVPLDQLLTRYAEDNAALRARVKELEAKQDELVAARERYLSEQHLRDMLQADQERTHARKDKMLKLVQETAPKLLMGLNPEAQAVVKLVRSLNEEQRGMLLMTDLLNEEQKELVRGLLAGAPETAQAAE